MSEANGVLQAAGAIVTYSMGFPLLRANIERWSTSRTARWVSVAMMAVLAAHLALTIGFWNTIDHVTHVVTW